MTGVSPQLKEFEAQVSDTESWLKNEYAKVRTGRATPSLLDGISVDQYGQKSPISHLGTVTLEDARTLRIVPWDKPVVKDIEAAIGAANLGVSVVTDNDGARVIFPELTGETRGVLKKLVADRLEQARVSLKRAREEAWQRISKLEKDKEIGEDEKFKGRDDLQRITDAANKTLADLATEKEEELEN